MRRKTNTPQPRTLRLFEAGSALIFFGILSQQAGLKQSGIAALAELSAQGYQVPSGDDPVRIFPALTQAQFSSRHAGGWRPGSIYLRDQPEGGFDATVYLRHELFHEASFKSCGGRLPEWAEEAAAMRFSGELAGLETSPWPSETQIQDFKARIQQGAVLDGNDRELLKRLAGNSVLSTQPCAVPAKLATLLKGTSDQAGTGYLLMSLPSARILASGGDLQSRLPPGSLLKIPYAAALREANPNELGKELATSDTDKLLERRAHFQPQRYRLLLSSIRENHLLSPDPPQQRQDWRALLGERNADGQFALQTSLPELALTMRAALLSQADYFRGLSQNGVLAGSTLAGQRNADKQLLQQMQAIAKTGSAGTADGQPLYGHLLVAWPAAHPVFLAIFRQQGLRGAALLPKAAGLLKIWQHDYPVAVATVRVRLLALTPRNTWEAKPECPELFGPGLRYSLCGHYRILSTACGSRTERWVRGVLYKTADDGPEVLETDSTSYTDAVISAEAKTLTGSARLALRAVIAWNGSHGNHRHRDTGSLCDTTHCMVFLGQLPTEKADNGSPINSGLLDLLDRLAAANHLDWLPFSNGGEQHWQQQIPAQTIRNLFAENWILDIRRERRKNGGLFIHLYYPEQEETISCEIFRNTLKLPSCPDTVKPMANQDAWYFEGIGAGHGLGLSIHQAQALSWQGHSTEEILLDAYAGMAR